MGVTRSADGTIAVSVAHADGVLAVTGTYDEIAVLCDVLEQVALLATVSAHEDSWLDDVQVGADVVKLGIRAGGRVRLAIVPARAA